MSYQAKNLDVQKCKDHIRDLRALEAQRKEDAIKEAEARYSGYMQALADVSAMFECSNYEKDAPGDVKAVQYETLSALADSLHIEPRFTAKNTLCEMVSSLSEDITQTLPSQHDMDKEPPSAGTVATQPTDKKSGEVYHLFDGRYECRVETSRFIRSNLPKETIQDYIAGLMFFIEENTEFGSESSMSEDICAYLLTNFFGCTPATREEWEAQRNVDKCPDTCESCDKLNGCEKYNIELFTTRESHCCPECDEYEKPIEKLKDTNFMKALFEYYNSESCLHLDMTMEQVFRNFGFDE